MGLNDRKYQSKYKDTSSASESFAIDTGNNTEFATGIAAKYTTSTPSPSNNDWVHLRVDSSGNLKTTATISGDVNVDNNSVNTNGLIGKATTTNSDFLTAVLSANAFKCFNLPSGVSSIEAEDIVSITHISGTGVVSATYTRDDLGIVCDGTDPTTVYLSTSVMNGDETLIVYTNISRPLGAGAVTSAIPRTTLASDDPAVVALQKIDDWDNVHDSAVGTDGALVMGAARTAQPTAVTGGNAVIPTFDVYGQQVIKGTDWSTDTIKVSEADPLSSHHVEETLASVTNDADEQFYYYVDMDGYTGLNIHGELSEAGATGTATVWVNATWQDDGTAPASCAYQNITQYGFSDILDGTDNASYTADFVLALKDRINPKYVQCVVSAVATASWTLYSKKWY